MIKNKQKNLIPIITLVTYVGMIIVNSLANILPINGRGTGEVSDAYENLFAPAGLTFSIWILIYLLLFGYVVYQLTYYKDFLGENNDVFLKVGVLFSISSIANSIWIFAWHYNKILLSLFLMIGILISLIMINIFLRKKELNMLKHILIRLPFTVYLGWITVATIANITSYLVGIEWNQFGISEVMWTVVIIFAGMIIGNIAMIFYNSIAYGLVIIWAYIGIAIKHISEKGFDGQYLSIIVAVFIAISLLVAGEARLINKRIKKRV
jgi:hypothetical protein